MRRLVRGVRLELPMIGLIVVLWITLSLVVNNFAQDSTVTNVLGRSATDGLLAAGLTVCIISGQIDLSVGSVLAFSGVIFALVQPGHGLALGILAGILAGTSVGAVNALLVTVLNIDSFVATIGTLLLVQGAAYVASNGNPVAGTDINAALWIDEPIFASLTPRVVVLIAVVAVLQIFLSWTKWGRDLFAIGGNRRAASAAGIPIDRRVTLAFVLSGTTAGVAGTTLAIALSTGSPIIGSTDLLTAAAAALLGGVALAGGRGSVVASVLAVVALSSLAVGLELSFIHGAYQMIVTGLVLIAVAVSSAMSGQTFSIVGWRRKDLRPPARGS